MEGVEALAIISFRITRDGDHQIGTLRVPPRTDQLDKNLAHLRVLDARRPRIQDDVLKRFARNSLKLKFRDVKATPLTGTMARDERPKRSNALRVAQ